ncbi:hypothetical protein B0T16DRAFT_144258 [Cercophora newfieldiana]|uniref:Uncharacterized protein n=1 Tax=Cercophora newfieldiana TaxID=92897 RepID=A0AA40CQL2_9PEZI|nr:hypothetical protein B0T16DRAFT_144258 [Cercophora newfieldiana]
MRETYDQPRGGRGGAQEGPTSFYLAFGSAPPPRTAAACSGGRTLTASHYRVWSGPCPIPIHTYLMGTGPYGCAAAQR